MTTAYGVSEQYNTYSPESPIHRVGQGLYDAPSKWTCTINTPLKCYDDNAKGCVIQDPSGQIKCKQSAKMYVDDNKTMHNNGQNNAAAVKLMEFVDHDINIWDGLLWLTGG
eukprot:14275985-Ditylum_brightwellii.AAC.1